MEVFKNGKIALLTIYQLNYGNHLFLLAFCYNFDELRNK